MGNCIKNSNNENPDDLLFYRDITLSIKCKSYTEKIKIVLADPEKSEKKVFSYPTIDFYYNSCVIPGQDPRGEIEKVCQDNLFVVENKDCLLFGIFDGHGKHGAEVVKFCADYMTTHFLEGNFNNSPKESLNNLIEECDRSLLNESKIDCSTSGTTAVILYINQEGLWACSVGDSRAVLGTLPKYEKVIEHNIIETPYKKPIIPVRHLKSVQLTLDQKPNISYELERIIKAGGVVQQLSNSEGKKIGPYRIWKTVNGKIPGLAMSRSIGDSIAKTIGVISKPISYYLPLCNARDQFIILGTDGIWDAMDNTEVTNFIDKYRDKCSCLDEKHKKIVSASNSNIAEFLCEEARFRWFEICSEEDVAIDDISAIVLEIKFKEGNSGEIIRQKGITIDQTLEVFDQSSKPIVITERFDIKRGSNAVIEEDSDEEIED